MEKCKKIFLWMLKACIYGILTVIEVSMVWLSTFIFLIQSVFSVISFITGVAAFWIQHSILPMLLLWAFGIGFFVLCVAWQSIIDGIGQLKLLLLFNEIER